MLGSRAIYHDGWKAVAFHPVGPLYDDGLKVNAPFDDDVWELYHVAEDHSEVHDRGRRVSRTRWRSWSSGGGTRPVATTCSPSTTVSWRPSPTPSPITGDPRDTFRYFQGGAQVPEPVAVNVRNRSHAIAVTIDVPEGRCRTACSSPWAPPSGGWSLHVLDGPPSLRPQPVRQDALPCSHADAALGSGRHTVGFTLREGRGPGGPATLLLRTARWWPRA